MEIQERLSKYLDEIEKAVSTAAEFSAEQAPQVVQEFLAWEFWSGAAMACCLLAGILILSTVLYRSRKFFVENWEASPLLIIPAIAIAGMSIGVSINVSRAAKVTIAPRIVLLEKVTEMVKK